MNETQMRYYRLGCLLLFFAGGILGVFKPAYDYTLIKNVAGFVFCLLASLDYAFEGKQFSFSPLVFSAFTLLVVWNLVSAFLAPCGYAAAGTLEQLLLYYMIFLLATQLLVEKVWVYFWLGSAFLATVIALVQDAMPSHYGISTFGNPNFFAGHIIMPLLLAVALLRQKQMEPAEKFFLAIFILSGVSALILSKSRAAISGFAFGLASLPFFIYFKKGKSAWKTYAGMIVFFLAIWLLWPKIHTWFLSNIRYYIWQGTWRMVRLRPVFGWGLGNFQIYYPWFRFREYFRQAESTPVTNNPHNRYLETWCETGLIGLILFLGFVILLLYLTAKRKPSRIEQSSDLNTADFKKSKKTYPDKKKKTSGEEDSLDEIVRYGLASGILAVLADNFFSTNLGNASTAMYFWFSLGILANQGTVKRDSGVFFSKIFWIVLATVSYALAVFVSYYRITSQVYLKRGIWAKEAGQYQAAIEYYSTACRICPSDFVTWYKLAYVYGETNQLEQARKIYLHINDYLSPHFAKTDMNLGTIALKQGKIADALYHYRWAEWINPYDKDVLCSIASIYLIYYRDAEKAASYLKKVLTLDPQNEYANNVLKRLSSENKPVPAK